MAAETIVVGGSLAQKPFHGGHTWALLQYVLGFRELGWRVLFLDAIDPVAPDGVASLAPNVAFLRALMDRLDLSDSYALLSNGSESLAGLSRSEVLERTRASMCLFNIMGFIADADVLAAAQRRVFVDIDPGFPQMWRELGLHDAFAGYDAYVTIAENIGQPSCTIPTCGLRWITTPQPIVLRYWPESPDPGPSYTTVASWRGVNGPVQYRDRNYGLRVHEFRRFAELPRHIARPFELALDIHPNEVTDIALLKRNGWSLIDPKAVAGDPWAYQQYVRRSRAEFMVAKSMYVQSRSGWISDRSLCYLASGRPVIAQDTGFVDRYPVGEGLLAFSTLDEAVDAIEGVSRDYERHATAARGFAEEYFDSSRVLGRLAEQVGSV